MKRYLILAVSTAALVLLVLIIFFSIPTIIKRYDKARYKYLEPDETVQTLDDFLARKIEIQNSYVIEVRGVTYYHLIGPFARSLPSDGALYVFDARGNYVGWSRDSGDVLRTEAIFYPAWWLPKDAYTKVELPLEEIVSVVRQSQAM
ncbi:MAG: hypothetical protein AMXMBFR82_47820 [Candidatus Hydrogenedentota bacterium]